MEQVRQYIAEKQSELGVHPFLRRLAENPPLAEVVPFVPLISFFVLGFQDVMRMTGERADDPRLRDILRRHCEEEVGHERWFFQDVDRLAGHTPDLAAAFGPRHYATRLCTYALTAEVLRAVDDAERLCLIFSLEAAAEACFGGAEAYFTRVGVVQDLAYFAGVHRETEQDHAVFEASIQAIVAGIALDAAAEARVRAAVDRTFAALSLMLDGLAVVIGDRGRAHA